MSATTDRRFSAAQEAYMQAQALYDTINAAHCAEAAKIHHLADTDEDAWLAALDAIDAQHDTASAYDLLAEAERNLCAWGRQQVATLPAYRRQRALLDGLFARAERDVTARKKVADITMQLAA